MFWHKNTIKTKNTALLEFKIFTFYKFCVPFSVAQNYDYNNNPESNPFSLNLRL